MVDPVTGGGGGLLKSGIRNACVPVRCVSTSRVCPSALTTPEGPSRQTEDAEIEVSGVECDVWCDLEIVTHT